MIQASARRSTTPDRRYRAARRRRMARVGPRSRWLAPIAHNRWAACHAWQKPRYSSSAGEPWAAWAAASASRLNFASAALRCRAAPTPHAQLCPLSGPPHAARGRSPSGWFSAASRRSRTPGCSSIQRMPSRARSAALNPVSSASASNSRRASADSRNSNRASRLMPAWCRTFAGGSTHTLVARRDTAKPAICSTAYDSKLVRRRARTRPLCGRLSVRHVQAGGSPCPT